MKEEGQTRYEKDGAVKGQKKGKNHEGNKPSWWKKRPCSEGNECPHRRKGSKKRCDKASKGRVMERKRSIDEIHVNEGRKDYVGKKMSVHIEKKETRDNDKGKKD